MDLFDFSAEPVLDLTLADSAPEALKAEPMGLDTSSLKNLGDGMLDFEEPSAPHDFQPLDHDGAAEKALNTVIDTTREAVASAGEALRDVIRLLNNAPIGHSAWGGGGPWIATFSLVQDGAALTFDVADAQQAAEVREVAARQTPAEGFVFGGATIDDFEVADAWADAALATATLFFDFANQVNAVMNAYSDAVQMTVWTLARDALFDAGRALIDQRAASTAAIRAAQVERYS